MSHKNRKQFGIWMDTHHATIIGKEAEGNEEFVVIGHVENAGAASNSNENASNHEEIALTHKFFKEIAAKMQNVDEVHLTGTGQIQEQFAKFLSDTPQYKNTVSQQSTSNKMSDEALVRYVATQFN